MARRYADGTAPVGGTGALADGEYADATAPVGRTGALADGGYADATAPVGRTDALADGGYADATAPVGRTDALADGGYADATAPSAGRPGGLAAPALPDAPAAGAEADLLAIAGAAGGPGPDPLTGYPDATLLGSPAARAAGRPEASPGGPLPPAAGAAARVRPDRRRAQEDAVRSGPAGRPGPGPVPPTPAPAGPPGATRDRPDPAPRPPRSGTVLPGSDQAPTAGRRAASYDVPGSGPAAAGRPPPGHRGTPSYRAPVEGSAAGGRPVPQRRRAPRGGGVPPPWQNPSWAGGSPGRQATATPGWQPRSSRPGSGWDSYFTVPPTPAPRLRSAGDVVRYLLRELRSRW